MLRSPRTTYKDPITEAIALEWGWGNCAPQMLEPGVFLLGHFNLDLVVWGGNRPAGISYDDSEYMLYPWIKGLPSYGVCDSPKQFLSRYRDLLEEDPRTFVMSFTHIAKDPSNAGQRGGWRWHKWGPYIGDGEPTTEYLDDEPGFARGVYVYHILQTEGPEIEDPEAEPRRVRQARIQAFLAEHEKKRAAGPKKRK